eukprot:3237359-Alexandrium_andersonii.AAC.1
MSAQPRCDGLPRHREGWLPVLGRAVQGGRHLVLACPGSVPGRGDSRVHGDEPEGAHEGQGLCHHSGRLGIGVQRRGVQRVWVLLPWPSAP